VLKLQIPPKAGFFIEILESNIEIPKLAIDNQKIKL